MRSTPRGTIATILFTVAVTTGMSTMPAATADRGTATPGAHVEVSDFRFEPTEPSIELGGTVIFDFVGPSHHTATDGSGLYLYDSGSVGAGGPSTSFTFQAAGVYRFTCSPHPWMGGRVAVPVDAAPSAGPVGSTFIITWASVRASTGFVYDVQRKRLGHTWSDWRTGVVARRGQVTPSIADVVRFRARLRKIGAAESLWSGATAVAVG